MKRPTRSRRPMIPAGEIPCVWMTAGVLNFRLCDRDLDCCRCPLDQALRNVSPAAPRIGRGVDRDLFYHPGHTWVRALPDGKLAVGLDRLAQALLGEIRAVRDLPERIEKGAPATTLESARGPVRILAPFDGVVTDVNGSPGEGEWFLRGIADDTSAALAALRSGCAAEDWAAREDTRLADLLSFAGAAEINDLPPDAARRIALVLLGDAGELDR